MPNRDTFRVTVTVCDDYEDAPETLLSVEEHLATGQRTRETVAALLRCAALLQNPEGGGERTVEAIRGALNRLRADAMKGWDGVPKARNTVISVLWDVAEALDVEWCGHRPSQLDDPSVKASGGEGRALGGALGHTPDASARIHELERALMAMVPLLDEHVRPGLRVACGQKILRDAMHNQKGTEA